MYCKFQNSSQVPVTRKIIYAGTIDDIAINTFRAELSSFEIESHMNVNPLYDPDNNYVNFEIISRQRPANWHSRSATP